MIGSPSRRCRDYASVEEQASVRRAFSTCSGPPPADRPITNQWSRRAKRYLERSMFGVRKIETITRLTTAACAGLLIFSSARTMSAQVEEWTPPHPMLLTAERALSMVLAVDRKLDYVPGEVLVRFRAGVNSSGQQRALMALRSRPAPSDLRWVGDVAVLSDRSEHDATILAAQLRTQPEVESAEPTYPYAISARPNDLGVTQ